MLCNALKEHFSFVEKLIKKTQTFVTLRPVQYTLYSTLHADNFDSPPKVNKTNRAETTRFVAKSKQRSVTKAECVIL